LKKLYLEKQKYIFFVCKMSFYRLITRERTLCSFREFSTNDQGLKESITNFAKPPRKAVFFKGFQIQEDYYSKRGVNLKNKNEKSKNYVFLSDLNRSDLKETRAERGQKDEISKPKEKRALASSLREMISKGLFQKRSPSCESFMSGINSSYETEVSAASRDSEIFERFDDDLDSVFSNKADVENEICSCLSE